MNENPEVPNASYGCYDQKFYFNFLAEDKAGFMPSEWRDVSDIMDEYPDMNIEDVHIQSVM